MARPRKTTTTTKTTTSTKTNIPTQTDEVKRAQSIGSKYDYLGEDHVGGKVVLVFERRSDQHVFTVNESAMKDAKGTRVPEHIRERLV